MLSDFKSKVYYEDEDFMLKVEELDGHLFMHVDVTNWTPSSYKRGVEKFEEVIKRAYWGGYEAVYTYIKNPKFAKMFGSPEWLQTLNHNDEQYELMRWKL